MNRFLSLVLTLLLMPIAAIGQSTAILDGIGLANGKSYTNYIKNPNAQKNVSNVTASKLTVARSTTTPLYNSSEFNLTSSGTPWSATWSTLAFNEGMKNRLCEVQVMLRGTAAGTTTLEVLQNSVAVFSQTVVLDATNPKKYGGTFPCGDLTYASTVKLGGTGATTGAIEAGAVYLGEPVSVSSGAVVTEWQSYTPTISSGSGSIANSSASGKWRRVGDSVELQVSLTFGTSPGTFTTPQLTLPPGLTIDTSKVDKTTFGLARKAQWFDVGANVYYDAEIFFNQSALKLEFGYSTTAEGNAGNITQAFPTTWTNGDYIAGTIMLPISGWSATDIVTPEASISGQARYTTNAAQSIAGTGSSVVVDFEDKVYDINSEVTTGAGWLFTAKSAGYYQVNARVTYALSSAWGAGEYAVLELRKNSSTVALATNKVVDATGTQEYAVSVSDAVYLNTGDTLDVRTAQTSGSNISLVNVGSYNYVSISKITGPGSQSFYISSPLVAAADGTGIKFKSSTYADIGSATDAGAWTLGSSSGGVDHTLFTTYTRIRTSSSHTNNIRFIPGATASANTIQSIEEGTSYRPFVFDAYSFDFKTGAAATTSRGGIDVNGAWTLGPSGGAAHTVNGSISTFSGNTASLGSGGAAAIATTVSGGAYLVHVMGNGNSTQYAHAMVYSNNSGGITVTTIGSSTLSIISGGTNQISVQNGTTTQTIKFTVLRLI